MTQIFLTFCGCFIFEIIHVRLEACPSPLKAFFFPTYYLNFTIQSVKKYMLQRSVVDRWVQSDHILLIHPCPETLPFVTKGHKIFRENAQFYGMLSLFYITKVAQNGGRQPHCATLLCYAEFFERFPAFPGWFQLPLQFLPQDHVSPLESRTPGFACITRERNPKESSQRNEGARSLVPA
jgi:hypothetical protein